MRPGIPQEAIDQVREAADIVEVIGRYVNLNRSGAAFKGLCPFHPEKTPSFIVNPERRIYKCFGCGEGGNVFSFLMKQGGMTFPEAVRELAESYGVPLPREDLSPQEAKKVKAKDRMVKIMTAAADYFQSRLWSREGNLARAYLLERSIPKEVAKRFGLGWAEDRWDGLLNHFAKERVNPALLERAGLVSPRKSGSGHYDRFRGRLIFPILDHQGRVVAFGGRVIEPDKEPKYLNSPETPLFKKGRILYNLHQARPAIRKRRRVIAVEGYFDCLSLAAAGITNTVATMGTALTGAQVRAMRGLGIDVVLVYDADFAGLKAAMRAQKVFSGEEVPARIMSLPDGLDPDDFIREHGPTRFLEEIEKAKPMIGFMVDKVLEKDLSSPESKAAAVRELAPVLSGIASPVEQASYVQQVAARLDITSGVVLSALSRATRTGDRGRPDRNPGRPTESKYQGGTDRRYLSALINFPPCRQALFEAGLEELLTDPLCRSVAGEAAVMTAAGRDWQADELINYLDPEGAELVVSLDLDDIPEDEARYVSFLVAGVRKRLKDRNIRQLESRIRAAQALGNEDEVLRLLGQLSSLTRKDAPGRSDEPLTLTTGGHEAV